MVSQKSKQQRKNGASYVLNYSNMIFKVLDKNEKGVNLWISLFYTKLSTSSTENDSLPSSVIMSFTKQKQTDFSNYHLCQR